MDLLEEYHPLVIKTPTVEVTIRVRNKCLQIRTNVNRMTNQISRLVKWLESIMPVSSIEMPRASATVTKKIVDSVS